MIRITHRDERASIYTPVPDQPTAWSLKFDRLEPDYGYMRTDEPSEFIQRLAVLVRNEVYPEHGPIGVEDLRRRLRSF